MKLELITGGIGSGKSSFLYKNIITNLQANPTSKAVLLVPEQFSYTAEKTLSEAMGGLGLNNIEVLTFSRLCSRYLQKENTLLPSGKMMLIQKAVSRIREDNLFYLSSKRTGFTESVAELFSELKRYGITPADFDSITIQNQATSQKLSSINEIYKLYTDCLSEDFADSDDDINKFADYLMSSDTFSDAFIYIDDYNDFLPQHYSAIKAFLCRTKGVYITLGLDTTKNSELFKPVKKTVDRLSKIACSLGMPTHTSVLTKNADYIKADDLRFLMNNWDFKPNYNKKSENIRVFNALDVYSEAEHTASQIIGLVRDSGYRFRDIGVICGDMDKYLYLITSVFKDFNIPFFADEKISVSMQPIAKTVLSLFKIISENWSYNAVFSYLRSGYIYEKDENGTKPISQEEIDILENYVLLHGIKGKKMWFEPWTENGKTVFDDIINNYSREESDLELLNNMRLKIITPFVNFLENKGRTATAIAEAVFKFICDINLYDGLLSECENLEKNGFLDESEQFKQTWNILIETLDQLVRVLGKGTVSREDFASYFECGLSGSQISIIPSGLDRVSIGTVSRNSPSRVKVLFILGALEGQIPKAVSEGTILSDTDRKEINTALLESQKELAPDNIDRIALENLKLYRTLSTATEKLYISFPSSDNSDSPPSASRFLNDIISMFDLNVYDNIISKPATKELLASAKRGFYYLLRKLSEYYSETPEKIWQSVYDWYEKNPQYRDRLDILNHAAAYKQIQPALSKIKAEMLYGKNKKYSSTVLENYENCPFSYYLKQGLKLVPQEEKRIEKSHIGSLVHRAVYDFCRLVEEDATSISEVHKKWCELTPQKSDELIHKVIENMSEKVLSRAKYDQNQLLYLLARCESTLKASAETVRKSLSSGKYTAICFEKDFEIDIDWKGNSVTITGQIDRIDAMEDIKKGKLNIRIVDYKSGNKSFSITGVYDKVDMQLILYAIAASKMADAGILKGNSSLTPEIKGALYSKIHDPEIQSISEKEVSEYENKPSVNEKMEGIIVLDTEETEKGKKNVNLDALYDMDEGMTSGSDFLKVDLKADGTPTKNSSVAYKNDFEIMSRYIKKAVTDADKSIKSGKIDINPYRIGENSACDYCKFKEVCMFDEHFDNYRNSKKSDNYYEIMAKEVSENE